MEFDDKIRGTKGVVVCLRDMGDGTSRLFFDDVAADKEANPTNWSHDSFYTFSPMFSNSELEDMSLSAQHFEQIGVAVVARLLALNGRVK
ncbi:hypothetical protein [Pseudoxanthomonas mexicana]|uniref:hypothetical protein n=1 Tax=Pseudoxanthomonas mexicana TaxID=128785 RepID=UPI001FD715FB|nr:hypothetical protein [Pseudoxanthomonas mexicana]UOV01711.1 hypothetical protein MUU73_17480 [Pseudoxanthomonas mexicana]